MVENRKLFDTGSFPPPLGVRRDFGSVRHKPNRSNRFGTKLHVCRSHHFPTSRYVKQLVQHNERLAKWKFSVFLF